MSLRALVPATLLFLLCAAAAPAAADHIPGRPCSDCASHEHWPTIGGIIEKAKFR
jgi:hypothetical protein